MIKSHSEFELCNEPTLNILTYRYCPQWVTEHLETCDEASRIAINDLLNRFTKYLQKIQRGHGKAFVSRTKLTPSYYQYQSIIVFRVVLANPLTSDDILADILAEQVVLANDDNEHTFMSQLRALVEAD